MVTNYSGHIYAWLNCYEYWDSTKESKLSCSANAGINTGLQLLRPWMRVKLEVGLPAPRTGEIGMLDTGHWRTTATGPKQVPMFPT
jgi:hypothetical protein